MSRDNQEPALNAKIVIRPEEVAEKEPAKTKPTSHASREKWLVGASIAVVVLLVAIIAVVLIWNNIERSPNAGTASASDQSSATLAYWDALRRIGDDLDKAQANTTEPESADEYAAQFQQQREAISSEIDQISDLPTLDVDPAAIELGLKTTELLGDVDVLLSSFQRLVNDARHFGARANSAEMMIESFVRGFFGDPFGTHDELKAEQGTLSARHQQLLDQAEVIQRKANELRVFGDRTRATLTARYGTEFAPLD